METRVLTAHIPLPLAEKVDELATRLDRSKTWVIKQALSAWLAQEEDKYQLTLEALKDVDKGEFFNHTAVQAWAASLDTTSPLPAPNK